MEKLTQQVKQIPYGVSNFYNLREEKSYYVDKTRFLPLVEQAGKFLFFIRPRRMGKSLWLSMMETYYDIALKDRFEQLFYDTWILDHPTASRGAFLVLRLNFSDVNPNIDRVETSFETIGKNVLNQFCRKYSKLLGDEFLTDVKGLNALTDKFNLLFHLIVTKGLKLYLLIDEYDNFANTILSSSGSTQYHNLTHGEGFFRHFFNALKGGTMITGAGQIKLFITGVSPITMDDVTSGFNIGVNVSLDNMFNEMLGFTESELIEILDYYIENNKLQATRDDCLKLMKIWYNNYQFSLKATCSIYNTDMVLYFINTAIRNKEIPRKLIDPNVRIDYNKLRHLITIDKKLNGNFDLLLSIVDTGQVEAEVAESFPLEELTDPNNFNSLLYFFGLLTFSPSASENFILKIPNQTVKQLMFGYIRDALKDVGYFRVNVWELSKKMRDIARHGEWKPAFEFLAEQIARQTSIRDYLHHEKIIQGILAAYLNINDCFVCFTEPEFNKQYADFLLIPNNYKFPSDRYGCIIELKYITRKEYTPTILQQKITEAKSQLKACLKDPFTLEKTKTHHLLKLIVVFSGWELVYKENVP